MIPTLGTVSYVALLAALAGALYLALHFDLIGLQTAIGIAMIAAGALTASWRLSGEETSDGEADKPPQLDVTSEIRREARQAKDQAQEKTDDELFKSIKDDLRDFDPADYRIPDNNSRE